MKKISTFMGGFMMLGVMVLLFLTAAPAAAGGWAVVTLTTLPTEVTAEEPTPLHFVVRGHGRVVVEGLSPVVTAVHADTGESLQASAQAQKDGDYVVTLTFPYAGRWDWSIQAYQNMPHVMPPFEVQPAVAAAAVNSSQTVVSERFLPVLVSAMLGVSLVGMVVGVFVWLRTRQRWALAVLVMAVLLAAGGWVTHRSQLKTAVAQAPLQQTDYSPSWDRGERLFVAKGCVTCHVNERVDVVDNAFSIKFGPDLSRYVGSPEFVQTWLKSPESVRPQTLMPNLQLKDEEIASLILFLSEETDS